MRFESGHDGERLNTTAAPVRQGQFVESTSGVVLAVHDLGDRDDDRREPVLLVHATGFHGYVWRPLADHLHDRHPIAPDLRGHGDSTPPRNGNFAWDGFADDVLAVADQLDLHGIDAVGHSKGGAALLLAEQRRPGTFRSLYLYEPVVIPPTTPTSASRANPLSEGARRRRAVFASRDEAFDNFAGKPPLDALDPVALRAYVDHGFEDQPDGTVRLKCAPEDEAEVYLMGSQHGAFAHLGSVACPVTVARGGDTEFGPAAFAGEIVAAIPHGRLEVFEDLGHFGPLEQPGEVAAAIERSWSA